MALNGNDMGTLIKDRMVSAFSISPVNQADLTLWAQTVGNAIVDYIKANAELDSATVIDGEVSGSIGQAPTIPLDDGVLVDGAVSGGIK